MNGVSVKVEHVRSSKINNGVSVQFTIFDWTTLNQICRPTTFPVTSGKTLRCTEIIYLVFIILENQKFYNSVKTHF